MPERTGSICRPFSRPHSRLHETWEPDVRDVSATGGPRLRKCHEFETDLGVVAVRQPRTHRSHKINMSRGLRPYTLSKLTRLREVMGTGAAAPTSTRSGLAPPEGRRP